MKEDLKQKILDATNGGLQIIQYYYKDADANKLHQHFKIRDERTASASLKNFNGVWYVQDWGAWDKPKNGIEVCMYEENLDFKSALKTLAERYNISGNGKKAGAKAKFSKRPVNDVDGKQGTYQNVIYKDELSKDELAVIGKAFTNKVAERYNFYAVASYEYVSEKGYVYKFESTKEYPIFAFERAGFKKLYQPKATEKKDRFRYIGQKPADYVWGLQEIDARVTEMRRREEETKDVADETRNVDIKLDHIIIASGDRDALNLASFGKNPVWLNSETAKLDRKLYKRLKELADDVYVLPDIDDTGISAARKLGFKYLDLKIILLPKYLRKKTDHRGNACKDFTDFQQHYFNAKEGKKFYIFEKLMENALPMKFWNEYFDKNKRLRYEFNIEAAYQFLTHSGFYRFKTPYEKEPYCYIYIDGNIIRRVSPVDIQGFVKQFLKDRLLPTDLRNMVNKTPYLKEATLSGLPYKDIDFTDNDRHTQYWFFTNFVLEISRNGIKTYKPGEIKKYIWEDKIIELNASKFNFLQDDHFKIFKDASGNWDIEILRKDNDFLNFLINTSRMFWRKELETALSHKTTVEAETYRREHKFDIAGPLLDEDEIYEQKLHLINKIFALGYLLHKYKDQSRTWAIYGMDAKLSDLGESHGGSGKSLAFTNVKYVLKNRHYIPGRNKKMNFEFIYDGVTEDTDYIFIDDAHEYYDFQFHFSDITSSMKVNPKNNKPFEIPFEKSPKIVFTSNYPPKGMDPSTLRRILFVVFSDYYHFNKDDEYNETRQVSDDFGYQLFADWNDEQWQTFYNFLAQAVRFYLTVDEKMDAPNDEVKKRNLVAEMGAAFKDWAEVYFSKESGNLDRCIPRTFVWEAFVKSTKSKMSPNRFKKALAAFAKFNGLTLNPKQLHNDKNRILHRFKINDKYKTVEMIYLQTPGSKLNCNKKEETEADTVLDGTDTPF